MRRQPSEPEPLLVAALGVCALLLSVGWVAFLAWVIYRIVTWLVTK